MDEDVRDNLATDCRFKGLPTAVFEHSAGELLKKKAVNKTFVNFSDSPAARIKLTQ